MINGREGLDAPPQTRQFVATLEALPWPKYSGRSIPRTVPPLLRKSKAWASYCDAEQPLEQAIKRLGKAPLAA
jgi:hypothetical protein